MIAPARVAPESLFEQPGSLLGTVNLGLGLALLLGGPLRTSSPSYAIARQMLPMHAWGLLFVVGGLVCLLAPRSGRWGAAAVGAGAGIHAFWALALWQAAATDPKAAITGAWVYTWLALTHLVTGLRLARQVG